MAEKIGVIGAGAWGTALSMLLADKGHDVTLWMYEKDLAEETGRTRENRVYLPGFTLPASFKITSSIEIAVKGKSLLLSVSPPIRVRRDRTILPFLSRDAVILSASKGIEIDTLMPLSELFKDVLAREFHSRLCFLSGPSFAKEVAQKMPTAMALASMIPFRQKSAGSLEQLLFPRVYQSRRDRGGTGGSSRTSWPLPRARSKA